MAKRVKIMWQWDGFVWTGLDDNFVKKLVSKIRKCSQLLCPSNPLTGASPLDPIGGSASHLHYIWPPSWRSWSAPGTVQSSCNVRYHYRPGKLSSLVHTWMNSCRPIIANLTANTVIIEFLALYFSRLRKWSGKRFGQPASQPTRQTAIDRQTDSISNQLRRKNNFSSCVNIDVSKMKEVGRYMEGGIYLHPKPCYRRTFQLISYAIAVSASMGARHSQLRMLLV